MIRKRKCDCCGKSYQPKTARSRFCSDSCRVRNSRGAGKAPPAEGPKSENSLVGATRRELEAAGKADTMLGHQALALAARMSGTETTGGIAALSRELRTVMAAAVGAAPPGAAAAGQGDEIDELRARRDKKRAG